MSKTKNRSDNFQVDNNVIRQGDVFLNRLDKLPENLKVFEHKQGKKILQESEMTGHHHQFHPEAKVKLFYEGQEGKTEPVGFSFITENGNKYIQVDEPSMLYHGKLFELDPNKTGNGDHLGVLVPEGIYQVDIVREYDYEFNETRRVID